MSEPGLAEPTFEISPTPTEDEAAAIAAAFALLWPAEPPTATEPPPTAWRFSGRWWRSPRRFSGFG